MKRYIAAGLVLLVLAAGWPAQGVEEGAQDVQPAYSYTLDFALDAENKLLAGTETVTVTNYSPQPWDSLCFRDYAPVAKLAAPKQQLHADGSVTALLPNETSSHLSSIENLTTGGTLTCQRQADPSVLFLRLDEPLLSGESCTIRFHYQAQLFYGRGNLGWYI